MARRLEGAGAADVAAVRLFLELREERDIEAVLERREEIGQVIDGLEKQVMETRGIVERCKGLQAVPSQRVPTGF